MRIAVLAVVHADDRLLLVRRGAAAARGAHGYWAPPGGALEPGETEAAALTREVREETALIVEPEAALGSLPSVDGSFELRFWRAVLVSFAAAARVASAELDAVRWVSAAELETLEPMFDSNRRFLREHWPG